MPKYMMLLHSKPGNWDHLSPEEIQQIVEKYRKWLEQIHASGHYVVSDKLQDEGGKIVSLNEGRVTVVDGPYGESKEVIGGYFTLRAGSYEEAVAIARDSPFLQSGPIHIRETDPMGCGEE